MPFLTILLLLSLLLSPSHLFAQAAGNTTVPWTTVNVGSPLLGGSSTDLPCQPSACPAVSIQTSAAGWAATEGQRADELTFVYTPLLDAGAVVARLEPAPSGPASPNGPSSPSPSAASGLSIRVGLQPEAAAVSLVISQSGQLLLLNRTVAGGATGATTLGNTQRPIWLKLERHGTTVSAFYSQDGALWIALGAGTIPAASIVQAGVAAASENSNLMLAARASSLRVERLASLPTGWSAVAVGAPADSVDGWSYHDGAFVTVNSSGTINGVSDRFGFAYVRVTGDAELVARVLSAGTTGAAEAGVMARESLDPDAAHVLAAVSAADIRVTKRRIAAGLPTAAGPTRTVPRGWWLKLVRRGVLITTFESPDGASWTPLSSDTLPLPETFYLGLAFASGSGVSAEGAFDQVSVRAVAANQAPLVAIEAPTAGVSVTVGESLTVSASASDPDDRVDSVEFYVDGTHIGTGNAVPYQITWTGAQAGTRVLTAVAIDSEGARTTSAPTTVTVLTQPTSTDSTSGVDAPQSVQSLTPLLPPVVAPAVTPIVPPAPAAPLVPPAAPATPIVPPVVPVTPPPVQTPPASHLQLQFTPSTDHDRSVDRYVLQVFKGDQLGQAVALDLGKPAVANGICNVDVSSQLAALSAGSYVFALRAVDDDTQTSSTAATLAYIR